jgi:hypothetical protein
MDSTELTPYFIHTDDELGTTTMTPIFWTIPALTGESNSLSFDIFTAYKVPANYRYA